MFPPNPSKPFILINIGLLWAWKNLWGYGRKVHATFRPWGIHWDPIYDHLGPMLSGTPPASGPSERQRRGLLVVPTDPQPVDTTGCTPCLFTGMSARYDIDLPTLRAHEAWHRPGRARVLVPPPFGRSSSRRRQRRRRDHEGERCYALGTSSTVPPCDAPSTASLA